MLCRLGLAAAAAAWSGVAAAADPPLSVEKLLSDGWELAGYTGTFDNRSSLMLFRKREVNYLVQCSILFDVTRAQRVVTNCYEVR